MKFVIIFATAIALASAGLVPEFGFPEDDYSSARIINGKPAEVGAAPYIVSLKSSPTGSHFCGGSIINDRWILTAAHCLLGQIYVQVGLHNRNDNKNTQTIRVKKATGHEKYGGGVGPNDIALLELETAISFNELVQPVALPTDSNQQKGECTLYGWGKDTPNGGLPAILQTVTTDLVQFKECKQELPAGAPIADSNICSGSRKSSISACNGDSGGPLVINENGKIVQVGIVSWGYIPCGQANYPSVYTHTGSHLDWIKKVMN